MELSNDWHKKTNKRLFDILSDIMKESNAPKVPDHGYTIAEKAPEIVTAPGAYFPIKKGRVIPLESRQLGGRVGPKKSRIQQLEEAAGISEPTPETVPASEPAPATPAPKGFIAPPYTGPRPWTGSRQSVGMMAPSPKSTGTVRQILERLASYSPFPIPGVTTQKEDKLIPLADIMVDKKKTPLLPRQNGGEVDPNLFKNTFSVNYGDPTQNGIKTEANTALVESTPINVSPVSTPSSQPYVSQDGASLASTITPSTSPPAGMAEYEANARKIRGLPPETGIQTVNQTGGQPNQLSAYAPPGFKENTRSPMFGSDQLVAYNKKYGIAQEPDLYERLKASSDLSGMKPTTTGAPVVSPTKIASPTGTPTPPPPPNPADKWIEEAERKRQRAFRNSANTLFPDTMPLLSRQGGGPTSPDPDEGLTEEERKRRADALEMRKEVLPTGQTRYVLPGTEETAMVGPERFFVAEKEVPKGTPGAVSGDELARQSLASYSSPELEARKRWKTPGYREGRLAEARKEGDTIRIKGGPPVPSVIGVSPGYQKTYYEAHPEERFMDLGREENKPLMDAYQKLIEENTRRSQGFGLPMNSKVAGLIRAEATRAVPELAKGLEQTMALNQAIPERYFSSEVRAGKAGTPHWVQNEKGEWVGLGPTGITPTGVIGKTTNVEAPARRSEQTFDPKTGQTYQQDFDWREGTWQPVGERRVVGGLAPKEKPFKDRVLETIWGALTPDEQKKVLGAGIDPHEVTERDILSIQGNLMTSPETRKILQPLAESIIKKASEKSAAEKIIPRNPGETIEEYLKRTKQ